MSINSKTDESEQDLSKSISSSINSSMNEDNYEYNKPLPCSENLLDKYEIIQYKNIKMPRLKFENEYKFDKYKNLFNELLQKINFDFYLTKDFIQKIKLYDIQSIKSNSNKSSSITNKNNNNNKEIDIKQLADESNNIDIYEENKKINKNKLDIFINISDLKKPKNDKIKSNISIKENNKCFKKLFNLKIYDKNKTLICKKRGRKSFKKANSHTHSALDDDNILRKIQVHFLTFLVSFTNDYIDSIFPNINKKSIPHFRQIDYKVKRTINHKSIEEMKSLTIGEILKKQASPKNKTCVNNINELIYNKLCEQFPNIKQNYFNILFKKFFIEYYYNKNDNIIILNGYKINLSIKTKSFNYLIKKNINYSEKFRNIASYFYMKNDDENEEKNEKLNKNEEEQNNLKQKPFFIID
jgi:hypothetical protein